MMWNISVNLKDKIVSEFSYTWISNQIDASMMSMRRAIEGLSVEQIKGLNTATLNQPTRMADFEEAVGRVCRSVSASNVERYEKWMTEFGAT
ncbi:unnamed protein product [Schistosoma rodhaini]|nr:unnamed protein product [Schistosoma rodhaini]CAH8465452.1 unnamed protein product [Schistosoma rodhaini]